MKFKRTDIIAAIEKRISEIDEANRSADRKHEFSVELAKEKWRAQHQQAWIEFANNAIAHLSGPGVISHDDLPKREDRGWGDRVAVFVPPAKTHTVISTENLESAKAVLEASPDEFITSAGLKEIGFKDISRLMGGSYKQR